MKVSVIISSHNYSSFIANAIESVIDQDYEGDVECLVVDDGSTDNTHSVIKPYLEKITFISQKNKGQSSAINSALANTSGNYIFFLDADDYWRNDKISRVLELYSADTELGLIHHPHILVNAKNQFIDWETNPRETPITQHLSFSPARGDIRSMMLEYNLPWMFNTTSSMSMPRWLCDMIFPLPETININADTLFAPVAATIAKVGFIDKPLSYYRIHGKNNWAPTSSNNFSTDTSLIAIKNLALLNEQYSFAEKILAANDIHWKFNAKGTWPYIRKKALAEGKPYIYYVPAGLLQLFTCDGALRIKIKEAKKLFKMSISHTTIKDLKNWLLF